MRVPFSLRHAARRSPWPRELLGQEPAGKLAVSVRRGVAAGGFTQVSRVESVPLAAVFAAARATERADTFITVPLGVKAGEGSVGKLLLRVVRACV